MCVCVCIYFYDYDLDTLLQNIVHGKTVYKCNNQYTMYYLYMGFEIINIFIRRNTTFSGHSDMHNHGNESISIDL